MGEKLLLRITNPNHDLYIPTQTFRDSGLCLGLFIGDYEGLSNLKVKHRHPLSVY